MVFVFKPSENVKEKIMAYYQNLKKDTTPPYAVFQAMDADTTITLYESGKVMFQGISADIDANIWIQLEKKINNRDIPLENNKKEKEKKPEENTFSYLKTISTLGSDEVGTGDYFGPIVVSATYVSKENIAFLKELKVGDSKKITDDKIKELAPLIMEKIPYSTFILSNEEYNNLTNSNMNKIKAILHNKVLLNLIEKENLKPEKIVIDQFVNSKKYYEYISDAPKILKNILFLTKAEDQVYSVAAASIISRYVFLAQIKKLSEKINNPIPLGAGSDVDKFAKKLIEESGIEVLNSIAKLNFKNTQKILGDS